MKIIFLLRLICLMLAISAIACASDKPFMQIFLTTGERSKDSHSEKITITLNGNQLTFVKTVSGRYGNQKPTPINKTFNLTNDDIKAINDLLRQKQFHKKGEVIERDVSSPSTYFDWSLIVNSNDKQTTNKIVAKRNDGEIKNSSLYKNADEFMRGLFAIIKKYDAAISYAGFN